MKNEILLFALFVLLICSQSCNKSSYCDCESKGELFKNLRASVADYGNFVLRFDQPVKGYSLYVVCEGFPDSLKMDSLKVMVSGRFKDFCNNPNADRIGPPMSITRINKIK